MTMSHSEQTARSVPRGGKCEMYFARVNHMVMVRCKVHKWFREDASTIEIARVKFKEHEDAERTGSAEWGYEGSS